MKEPKIEKGIPMPISHVGRGGERVKFMKKLLIGDSFYTEITTPQTFSTAAKRAGIKIVRKSENGGYRIWRTE